MNAFQQNGLDFGQAGSQPSPPPTLSKRAFGEAIGVSPGRVTQLISSGLPVEPNGRIDLIRGRAWYLANVDTNRRRGSALPDGLQSPQEPTTPRAARDQAEAEISRLKAERLAGRHIDRRATLRAIEGRAKYERDAWIGWVNRAAPAIAAATGADLSTITAALDREVREQLVALASSKVEIK